MPVEASITSVEMNTLQLSNLLPHIKATDYNYTPISNPMIYSTCQWKQASQAFKWIECTRKKLNYRYKQPSYSGEWFVYTVDHSFLQYTKENSSRRYKHQAYYYLRATHMDINFGIKQQALSWISNSITSRTVWIIDFHSNKNECFVKDILQTLLEGTFL